MSAQIISFPGKFRPHHCEYEVAPLSLGARVENAVLTTAAISFTGFVWFGNINFILSFS